MNEGKTGEEPKILSPVSFDQRVRRTNCSPVGHGLTKDVTM